jgi:serine protease Do
MPRLIVISNRLPFSLKSGTEAGTYEFVPSSGGLVSALSSYIASKAPGTTVNLRVLRGSAEQTIAVTLGTFPEETADADNESSARGQLGMTLRNLTPDMAERLELPRASKGVVVTAVEAGEAAEEAGLSRGDVIVSVNGAAVGSVGDFEREIDRARPDGVARLRVRRQGGYSFLVLKLK